MTIGEKLRGYREGRGILRFVDEQFHVTPDRWQEETLELIASPKVEDQRIAMVACAGPGKSAVLAWAGWWFLGTQGEPGEHPKGLVTAITADNLKDNLWAEYAKWQGVSPYLRSQFTWTSKRIFANDHPETWFLGARSWPKSASPDEQGKTFSGLHSKYVMCQVDESGGVPSTVLRAAEQALSRCAFGKIVQSGNPISLEGMLHEAATRLRHLWRVIRITGDPKDKNAWVYSPRVGPGPLAWAKQQIATYGRDNPWVMSYILGLFPPASINALLGIEEVEVAMARRLRPERYDFAQKRLGVDVARFGDDRTVIFPRQGLASFRPIVMRNARTNDIAARVAQAKQRWGSELELVDDTGHWGHGVLDQLAVSGIPALPVVFHGKAINPRYKNRRAEMWIEMAKLIRGGLALPNMAELVGELTTPTYTFSNGQFMLEEKDQVKVRLGRSPDLADALALTFAIPDMPNDVISKIRKSATTVHDFDPYENSPNRDQGVGGVVHDFDPFNE